MTFAAVWERVRQRRGVLVAPAGQRLPFTTLEQLNRRLNELAGWQEPGQNGELPSSG
jgi:hypothetical protein